MLPIDEMLAELRDVLETLDEHPTLNSLDDVFRETRRIERACEDYFLKDEE